jgi:hypothetical protein
MMYKLFLDMDGVLVDFERGVTELTGTKVVDGFGDGKALGRMWTAIAGVGDFYAKLHWMPDGEELWNTVAPLEPIILTGVPYGRGWADQKRTWIRKHLEYIPKIIIKTPGRTKLDCALEAFGVDAIPKDETWILVDDTPRIGETWITGGGVFILHKDTVSTLKKLLIIPEVAEDFEVSMGY